MSQLLPPGEARRLAEAFALLQRGRAGEAAAIAGQVIQRFPGSPEALHLRALCRKTGGDIAGALADFEAARRRSPRDPQLLGNYANLLSSCGLLAEGIVLYRQVTGLAPGVATGWFNLGLALVDAGDAEGAVAALERAVGLQPGYAPAWHGLGAARRAAGDLAGAENALRRAVALAPTSGGAWLALGIVRRLLGDPADALACHARAREAGYAGTELLDAEASAHLDLGDAERALAGARQLVQAAPGHVPGHEMLAHILWEHGERLAPDEDFAAAFRAAAEAQPDNLALQHALVRFLANADATEEALSRVESLRSRQDAPELVASHALLLERLGRREEAGRLLGAGYQPGRSAPGYVNAYLRHLLLCDDPGAAARHSEELLSRAPEDQFALAYLGLAWRMLGDPREEWLCGYETLVREVTVEPPAGYTDNAAFLAALEQTLAAMHTAGREPVNQSLRGGSQTAGVLFGRCDPVISALRDSITAAVTRYVASLPDDPSHPFLRRKSASIRYAGSWSVRLWSSGRHVNHVHQEGWISSAYYVSLPPSVEQAREGDTAGFIQFGEPPSELGLGLAPRRIVRPRPGRLVLFPSYVWHGTLPFTDDAPRMTVAFDAVPVVSA